MKYLKIFRRKDPTGASLISKAKRAFDIRDFYVLCGLGSLGYGLYLFEPWISFTVCGALVIVFGLLMGEK